MPLHVLTQPSTTSSLIFGLPDSTLGGPPPERAGNLDEPVPGPAGIDGPPTDRVKSARHEVVSSRPRDLLKTGGAGTLASAVAAAGFAFLGRRRR